MGNDGCCGVVYKDFVDSEENLFIKEQLMKYSNKIPSYDKVLNLSTEIFGLSLPEINTDDPLEWVTFPLYERFIKELFFEGSTKESSVNYVILKYNSKNSSVCAYNDCFHVKILIWIVGVSCRKKMSVEKKIKVVVEIIIKISSVLTLSSFSDFLFTYLEMMLIEMTSNFIPHNPKEINELSESIFNLMNLEEYHRWLINKMMGLLSLKKTFASVKNEFLTEENIESFFKLNPFVLSAVELRDDFYGRYHIGEKTKKRRIESFM